MSFRPAERLSFVLSEVKRDEQQQKQRQRKPFEDVESSAAAVAGSLGHFADAPSTTHVDAAREAPPKLKPRRTACSMLLWLWCFISVVVVTGLAMQTAMLYHSDAEDSKLTRRLARDSTVKAVVVFGVWDSMGAVTPLQLQVSVSVALGVRADDNDVEVEPGEAHFFTIKVQHATLEEADFVNTNTFLERLNAQLETYGGVAVLSRQARLHKNESVA
jgi:hypothetical protein